jgi:PAS domain S-box-containing protein
MMNWQLLSQVFPGLKKIKSTWKIKSASFPPNQHRATNLFKWKWFSLRRRKTVGYSFRAMSKNDDPAYPLEGAAGILLDVSTYKADLQAVNEEIERYQFAVQASEIGIWDIDDPANKFYFSPEAQRILGVDENMQGKEFYSLFGSVNHEDLQRIFNQIYTPDIKNGNRFADNMRYTRPDGRQIWFQVRGRVSRLDEQGILERTIGTLLDITEYKKIESDLINSELRYRMIVENQTELICRYLPDGELTFVNEAYAQYFQSTPDGLIGKKFWDFLFPDDRQKVSDSFITLTPETPISTTVHREKTASGEIRWFDWIDRAIYAPDGVLTEYQAVGRDITEKVSREQALRESEERFRVLAENASDLIAIYSWEDGRILYMSPSCEKLLGYSAQSAMAGEEFVLFEDAEWDVVNNRLTEAFNYGLEQKFESRVRRKDGQWIWLESSVQLIPDSADLMVIARDVTIRKEMEEAAWKSAERAIVLRKIDQLILESKSPNQFVAPVLEEVWHYLKGDLAVFFEYKLDSQSLIVVTAANEDGDFVPGQEFDLSNPQIIQSYRSGFIEWIDDLEDHPGLAVHLSAVKEAGYESLVFAPLLAQGEIIGGLCIASRIKNAFRQEDVDFSRDVAASLAYGIREANLLDELRQLVSQREVLRRASLDLAAELDHDVLLATIVSRAISLGGASGGGLCMWDEENNCLVWNVVVGETSIIPGSTIVPGVDVAGKVFQDGATTVLEDFLIIPGEPEDENRKKPFSAAAFPITWRQQKLGLLVLFLDDPQSYNQQKEDLIKLFVIQCAIAIANARLFEVEKSARSQLSQLNQYLQSAREEERAKIAREIHDEFGQRLTVMKMDASWLHKHLPENEILLRRKAQDLAELIDNTIYLMRQIATQLRPGILDDFGLSAAIEWQIHEFISHYNIHCDYDIVDVGSGLPQELATTVFRIFQETLTNIARHAAATQVDIQLYTAGKEIHLTVSDNGRGMVAGSMLVESGYGLIGMRERAASVGGILEISSSPGNGTQIHLTVPGSPQEVMSQ